MNGYLKKCTYILSLHPVIYMHWDNETERESKKIATMLIGRMEHHNA